MGSVAIQFYRRRRETPKDSADSVGVGAHLIRVSLAAFAVALNVTMAASLVEARRELAFERDKMKGNLAYYQYLHDSSTRLAFSIGPEDQVVGEPAIALHQIVCYYRDECRHCSAAKAHLKALVNAHDTAVYLILKNVRHIPRERLQTVHVSQVPAVFVDGKRAEGWEVAGFFDRYVNDCGC